VYGFHLVFPFWPTVVEVALAVLVAVDVVVWFVPVVTVIDVEVAEVDVPVVLDTVVDLVVWLVAETLEVEVEAEVDRIVDVALEVAEVVEFVRKGVEEVLVTFPWDGLKTSAA
jgi:hypothetical protein